MKENKKSNSMNDAFVQQIPEEHAALVNQSYLGVVAKVCKKILNRFHFDEDMSNEIAASAAIYVLSGCQTGKVAWPKSEGDWANMATWKAENLARDLIDRSKNRPEWSYDEVTISEEGEVKAESLLMVEASMDAWRRRQTENDRLLKIEAVRYATMKVANRLPTKGGNFLRNRKIVCSVYLDDLPMGEICQRYGLSRNHVYQILFKFRDMFAELGEKYMDEFYEWHGDEYLQVA